MNNMSTGDGKEDTHTLKQLTKLKKRKDTNKA